MRASLNLVALFIGEIHSGYCWWRKLWTGYQPEIWNESPHPRVNSFCFHGYCIALRIEIAILQIPILQCVSAAHMSPVFSLHLTWWLSKYINSSMSLSISKASGSSKLVRLSLSSDVEFSWISAEKQLARGASVASSRSGFFCYFCFCLTQLECGSSIECISKKWWQRPKKLWYSLFWQYRYRQKKIVEVFNISKWLSIWLRSVDLTSHCWNLLSGSFPSLSKHNGQKPGAIRV